VALVASLNQPGAGPHVDGHAKAGLDLCLKAHITDPCAGDGWRGEFGMTGSGCGGCSGGAFYLVGGGAVLPRSTSSVGMMTLREPSTGPV